MSELVDFIRWLKPLSKEKRESFELLKPYVDDDYHKPIDKLLRMKKVNIEFAKLGITIVKDKEFPQLSIGRVDKEIQDFCNMVNNDITASFKKEMFKELAKEPEKIKDFIAPHIIDMDDVKEAVLLQMFSNEHFHILLLGDPSTGKTDIIKSAADLVPLSSFGLGSGTSGVGLATTVKGKNVSKGLLPQADKGLCCIDELNLMKKADYASLYNAMEKGFVSYDKGGHHFKFDARVNILATGNPKGDKFKGMTIKTIKSQIPFESALLSRFHLLFIIKRPDAKKFKKITKKIIHNDKMKIKSEDTTFITEFIRFNKVNEVEFSSELEEDVSSFIEKIKNNEDKYLIEVSPRVVIGMIRLAKASARMYGRNIVQKDDVETAKRILEASLKIL
jgi:DNA replicative helicase MCM subunit Mcm2 (Cdc46/Mcm family)